MNSELPELRAIERQREVDPELAAKQCLEYVLAHPVQHDGYVLLGNLLLYLQRVDESQAAFEQAMQLNPADAAAHLGLGRVLMGRGSTAEARRRFEQALVLDPTLPGVSLQLARSRRFTSHDREAITSIESLLCREDLSWSALSDLHFALGKIRDDCDDYERAFHHYREANRLVHCAFEFDRGQFDRAVGALILTFSPAFFEMHGDSGQVSRSPVFIVGMPRSGTTLVEQILASHPDVFGAGELPYVDQLTRQIGGPVPYPRAAIRMDAPLAWELSERYLQHTRELAGDALRVTDKMPPNWAHLGFIATLFPSATIIQCRRDPLDTCLSIYFQQFESRNEWAYDLSDIAYFYRGYDRVMSHWKDVLPADIHEVRYEDLIGDIESTCRELITSCAIPWDPVCLAFYEQDRSDLSASDWQVRQPIYSHAVGRWKHYEHHLDSLKSGLGLS